MYRIFTRWGNSLEMRLRYGCDGKILPGVRRKKAGAKTGRQLGVPRLWYFRNRKVLPGMRCQETRKKAGRLGMYLRRCQQGKILFGMRGT